MKLNLTKSLVLLFIPFAVCAKPVTSPKHWPKEFKFQNQPIDPLCIYEAKDAETLVDLNNCGLKAEHGRKIIGKNSKLSEEGYVGYDYKWPGNTPISGSSYYKVLGKMDNRYIVISFNNTGGSGDFSNLSAVERQSHFIRVESFLNGDRCNNGITTASIKDNKLFYSLNITPADYLKLTEQNPNHLKAYDDLAACAACCQGVANFTVDNISQVDHPTLISVDLGQDKIVPDKNSQGIYQYCFDQMLTDYQDKQQTLTPEVLKEFVQRFNKECVKS